ncbi:hypothetical protein [Novosphingobium sp. ST904]|uniref:hypothetical protein n=1 Tax=Novosphingobium sp. ST904 TaxID=1684385 RepID=UPI0012E0DFFD|nr:hypothetical protein [Novosphingobium sp. ST904]
MRTWHLLAGASLAVTSAWAMAQDAPESLLPKMFSEPAPTQAPATPPPANRPATATPATAPRSVSTPVVQPLPAQVPPFATDSFVTTDVNGKSTLSRLPSLEELERMSPEDFEALLGDKLDLDMPSGARARWSGSALSTRARAGCRRRRSPGRIPIWSSPRSRQTGARCFRDGAISCCAARLPRVSRLRRE